MKVIKKTKERVLSIVLAFAMVLSSMTGLASMEAQASQATNDRNSGAGDSNTIKDL